MAKVTPETMMPVHVRTARAILGASTREFAASAGGLVTISKLRNLENDLAVSADVRAAIMQAFEKAGIELLNGGRPGARVKDQAAYKAALKALDRLGGE